MAPLPQRVQNKISTFAQQACQQGTVYYQQWMQEIESVRDSFARLINAKPGEIAFIKNTSEGISIVANGIKWKRGDNVVIPNIEFPANVYPWMNLERLGVEVRFVKAVRGCIPYEQIIAQINHRTRILSISSVEFNSGFRNNLKKLGEFCRKKGVFFCVDGIQSLGIMPMDVEENQIDFLAADGHKWLLSVEGLGGLYISSRVLEHVRPIMVGWDSVVNSSDYTQYDFTLKPDSRRFEGGSFNTMGIHAFGAALSIFHEIGVQQISDRVLGLGGYVIDQLKARGLKILSSTKDSERSGIICFKIEGDLERFSRFLENRKVTVSVRKSFVRISPHFYNSLEEVEHFFHYLDEFLKESRV